MHGYRRIKALTYKTMSAVSLLCSFIILKELAYCSWWWWWKTRDLNSECAAAWGYVAFSNRMCSWFFVVVLVLCCKNCGGRVSARAYVEFCLFFCPHRMCGGGLMTAAHTSYRRENFYVYYTYTVVVVVSFLCCVALRSRVHRNASNWPHLTSAVFSFINQNRRASDQKSYSAQARAFYKPHYMHK